MGSTVSVILGLVLAVLVLVLFTVKLKIHPFFALIATSATFAIVAGMNMQDMLSAFTSGMGGTIADIGLVIALGTVTGTLLEKSGAAETMAKTILKITGKKHAALGLAITGYFVSIPVFCDSAFVLLSPIARRLSKDTKISMTTMAISLAMGLHATHMFVPPTPGPLAVAGILNADLGMVILFGALVSIPVMLVGYFASLTAGKRYYYIPEDDSDVTEEEDENAKLPSALASFMPILVPILLMLLKTVGDMVASENILLSILNVIGTPAVALLIGMLLAAYTYHNIHPEDKLAWSFDGLVADSLRTAGQIVLIVGAGGSVRRRAESFRHAVRPDRCILRPDHRHPGSVPHRLHLPYLRWFCYHRHGHGSYHDHPAHRRAGLLQPHGPRHRHAGLRCRRHDGLPWQR